MFHVKHEYLKLGAASSTGVALMRPLASRLREGSSGFTERQDLGMAYMYILECCDRTLYVGSTRHLDRRLWEHNEGMGSAYTRIRLPVRLLYYEEFERVEDAFRREKQVQGWGRAKRLALVNGTPELLPSLSKKPPRPRQGDVSRETAPPASEGSRRRGD